MISFILPSEMTDFGLESRSFFKSLSILYVYSLCGVTGADFIFSSVFKLSKSIIGVGFSIEFSTVFSVFWGGGFGVDFGEGVFFEICISVSDDVSDNRSDGSWLCGLLTKSAPFESSFSSSFSALFSDFKIRISWGLGCWFGTILGVSECIWFFGLSFFGLLNLILWI